MLALLDEHQFAAAFRQWVQTVYSLIPGEGVAIDGKTARRAHSWKKGQSPLHMVRAWATHQRVVVGQTAVDTKSNDITTIPALWHRLAVTGSW